MICRRYFAPIATRLAMIAMKTNHLAACSSQESTANRIHITTRAMTICMGAVTSSANSFSAFRLRVAPPSGDPVNRCQRRSGRWVTPARPDIDRVSTPSRGGSSTSDDSGRRSRPVERSRQVADWSVASGPSPLKPTLHDVALGTDPDRLLKGAAEVIGAETRHSR